MILKEKRFTQEKIEKMIVESAFEYYKQCNFPYIKLRDFEIWQEFLALKNANGILRKDIVNAGHVLKSAIGQKICYHFMPHEWTIKCAGRALAPVDAFCNEKWLLRILNLCQKYERISDQAVRTFSKTVNAQFAANFAPSVARDIVNNYLGRNQIYYDYSSGFGGRLLGFIASDFFELGGKYIGMEPSTKTYIGLLNMIEFFGAKEQATIHRDVAEDFCPEELHGKVQLAFSSPPYFNREVYSDEPTQSCNKFCSWNDWLNGFWYKTIDNCYTLLKGGGHFIANIANIKIDKNTELDLIEKTDKYCAKKFHKKLPNLYLHMSGFGANIDKKKREVFLVFQKQPKKQPVTRSFWTLPSKPKRTIKRRKL